MHKIYLVLFSITAISPLLHFCKSEFLPEEGGGGNGKATACYNTGEAGLPAVGWGKPGGLGDGAWVGWVW